MVFFTVWVTVTSQIICNHNLDHRNDSQHKTTNSTLSCRHSDKNPLLPIENKIRQSGVINDTQSILTEDRFEVLYNENRLMVKVKNCQITHRMHRLHIQKGNLMANHRPSGFI